MQPIPETRAVLNKLGRFSGDGGLIRDQLQDAIDEIVSSISDCVGVSIAFLASGLTVTFIRTPGVSGRIDAMQYLDAGPCVQAIVDGDEHVVDDVLDEDRWQLFAQSSAAAGVGSSLSLPVRRGDRIIGSVNIYARGSYAFLGEERGLARVFGARVEEVVNNADLSMSTLHDAEESPRRMEERAVVDQAIGLLVARQRITPDEAGTRLADAARRAGVRDFEVAETILRTLQ